MSREATPFVPSAAGRALEPSAGLRAPDHDRDSFEYLRHRLSHDLRAPLRAMSSFASIVERRYADRLDDKGRDFVERMIAAGERAEALLDELVGFVRNAGNRTPGLPVDPDGETGTGASGIYVPNDLGTALLGLLSSASSEPADAAVVLEQSSAPTEGQPSSGSRK